jgi:hypothetical protein
MKHGADNLDQAVLELTGEVSSLSCHGSPRYGILHP